LATRSAAPSTASRCLSPLPFSPSIPVCRAASASAEGARCA
jgi:hypothetical protein